MPAAATTDRFRTHPWELNGYIAGYIGFLNLQKLAGQDGADATIRTQVTNELSRLQTLRASTFLKGYHYTSLFTGLLKTDVKCGPQLHHAGAGAG